MAHRSSRKLRVMEQSVKGPLPASAQATKVGHPLNPVNRADAVLVFFVFGCDM